jgi:hypothetical protein
MDDDDDQSVERNIHPAALKPIWRAAGTRAGEHQSETADTMVPAHHSASLQRIRRSHLPDHWSCTFTQEERHLTVKGKHSAKSLEDLEKYTASRVSKQGKMIFETDGMVLIGGITAKASRGKAVSEEESLRTARKKIKHFLSQVRLSSGSHAPRRLRPLPRPQRERKAGGHDLHPTGETPCGMTRKCAPLQDYGKALLMFRRRDAYQDGTVTRGDFKDVLRALSVGLTDAQEPPYLPPPT